MVYRILLVLLISVQSFAQIQIQGYVKDAETQKPLAQVAVMVQNQILTKTNAEGFYKIETGNTTGKLLFSMDGYQIQEMPFVNQTYQEINVDLQPVVNLTAIQIQAHKKREFALRRMQDVEGTSILAGKKNEVVLLDQITANKATNNARQVYAQVVGLNIFDYNDGGLQLGIGGRGLDPNRTANFNTRQNGYDISADVLGYPESYYTPATEALDEIQIIRGAASLQYGTQFGGLINFKFKEPVKNKKFEFVTRNTVGSNQLFTTFNSVSGTVDKVGYYGFVNYKKGDSFRPNSDFESMNYFAHLAYQLSNKTNISAEFTHFDYLAQQAGGLTDEMFYQDINQSNRARNWFQVDWNLANLKLEHAFNENQKLSTQFFAQQSGRDALGFRTNRITEIDNKNYPRDLIKGDFKNWGVESRYLQQYTLWNQQQALLIGAKFYKADNRAEQGAGNKGDDAAFNFDNLNSPDYPNQSQLKYPNQNLAFFGEHIFRLNEKFSITPGFRYEWIDTQAQGAFNYIETDLAGNIISEQIQPINEQKKRSFLLLGVGFSYKNPNIEYYANFSENYRSVTFNDIHIVSPNRFVAEDIQDETGYTFDIGLRGNFKNLVSFDTNFFSLNYDNRIGDYTNQQTSKRGRDNIGAAQIYGLEFFADVDLDELLQLRTNNFAINYFVNAAFTHAEYTDQFVEDNMDIVGNRVELVPAVNIKTGLGFGYRNFTAQGLLTYLSQQETDAQNNPATTEPFLAGIQGPIPAYCVVDFSAAYRYKRYKLEASINNLLNNRYFVRRASGYPGPGIIPSQPLNYAVTLEVKF